MRRIVIYALIVALIALPANVMIKAGSRLDLEELYIVTGGMIVDWEYTVSEQFSGIVQGKLKPDTETDNPIWSCQGCINGYCFMGTGGPVEPLNDESLACRMRVFIPSELDVGSEVSLGMDISVDNEIAHRSKLHLICVQPVEALFQLDNETIRVKEMATSGCVPTYAISEKNVVSPAAPQIRNERMMIPFRKLGEIIVAEVEWNSTTFEASYQLGPKRIILRKGIPTARVVMTEYDYKVEMDTAPDIISGSMMVPLRFVTDIIGGDVAWDNPTKTAIINFPTCK